MKAIITRSPHNNGENERNVMAVRCNVIEFATRYVIDGDEENRRTWRRRS